jgi:hypothetical protein
MMKRRLYHITYLLTEHIFLCVREFVYVVAAIHKLFAQQGECPLPAATRWGFYFYNYGQTRKKGFRLLSC